MINYFLTDRIAGEEVELVSDRMFMARSSASLTGLLITSPMGLDQSADTLLMPMEEGVGFKFVHVLCIFIQKCNTTAFQFFLGKKIKYIQNTRQNYQYREMNPFLLPKERNV